MLRVLLYEQTQENLDSYYLCHLHVIHSNPELNAPFPTLSLIFFTYTQMKAEKCFLKKPGEIESMKSKIKENQNNILTLVEEITKY